MHKFVQESSFLLNQYSAARPASERYGAAAHMVYIRPALAGASNDQAGRTARSVPEGVENYFKNLTLVTWHNRAWVRPSIQMQDPTLFQRCVAVSNVASKCHDPKTRAMQPAQKRSERIPASKLESSFYSRYFVVPKRDGGLWPMLDLRPIDRALCKRPFGMISMEQILVQIRPRDWLRPWI